MSMFCEFSTISDESIKIVRQHPPLILKWFCEEEEFESRFEPEKMMKADIYPTIWE